MIEGRKSNNGSYSQNKRVLSISKIVDYSSCQEYLYL